MLKDSSWRLNFARALKKSSGLKHTALASYQGFTLVELMVAIVLGLFVVGATMTVFMTTFAANSDILKTTRLNQELRVIMNLVAGDLTRAGHWGFAANAVISTHNEALILSGNTGTANILAPIPTILTNLGLSASGLRIYTLAAGRAYRGTVGTTDGMSFTLALDAADTAMPPLPPMTFAKAQWTVVNPVFNALALVDLMGNDCILYAADLNGNGTLNTANPDERLGLRYDAADLAIKRRQTGSDCMGGGWVNLSDERSVEITSFEVNERLDTIALHVDPVTGVEKVRLDVRAYEIRLAGRLKGSPAIQRELIQIVNPRNDHIVVL